MAFSDKFNEFAKNDKQRLVKQLDETDLPPGSSTKRPSRKRKLAFVEDEQEEVIDENRLTVEEKLHWNENKFFEQALDMFMNEKEKPLKKRRRTVSAKIPIEEQTRAQCHDESANLISVSTTNMATSGMDRESEVGITNHPPRYSPLKQPKARSKARSSDFRGVSKCTKDGRWQARIRIGSVVKYLGRFKSEVEAARCYDEAAHRYHGAKAAPNFKSEGEYKIAKELEEAKNLSRSS